MSGGYAVANRKELEGLGTRSGRWDVPLHCLDLAVFKPNAIIVVEHPSHVRRARRFVPRSKKLVSESPYLEGDGIGNRKSILRKPCTEAACWLYTSLRTMFSPDSITYRNARIFLNAGSLALRR
jgi:hypothetical protein